MKAVFGALLSSAGFSALCLAIAHGAKSDCWAVPTVIIAAVAFIVGGVMLAEFIIDRIVDKKR